MSGRGVEEGLWLFGWMAGDGRIHKKVLPALTVAEHVRLFPPHPSCIGYLIPVVRCSATKAPFDVVHRPRLITVLP